MNIPEVYLRRDFERARAWWGQLIDDAERRHGIPLRLLYAVYSRETNLGRHWDMAAPMAWPEQPPPAGLLTYFIRNAGDGGHGHGIGQVDDRSHDIPADWATNVAWQVDRSAEILAAALAAEGGDVVRAANRYNSGQGETSRTTGKDYGPDVAERWRFLVREFPPEETPMPEGPTAEKALQFLRDNLGLGESPPGSNRNWISEWYGMIGAWCAMTTSRALVAAGFGTPDRIDVPGLSTTSAKGWAYVPYLHHDFAAAGRYNRNPVVGDLVVFDWEGDGEGDHVGMLEEIVGDGTFVVLEGNTDDGVLARKRRPMSVINGFCHPPYVAAQQSQPEEEITMFIFDAPPSRGGGVWQSDGVFRKPVRTGDTWPNVEGDPKAGRPAVARHIGVATPGLFDDLIDIEAQLAGLRPAPVVDVDVEGLDPQAVADLVVAKLGGGLAKEVADLLAQRLAS